MLAAGHLEDRGAELVAVDRLDQVHLETRRPRARAAGAGRHQRDGRYRAAQADVQLLKLREELASGRFGRGEIADDDVGDERGPERVRGAGGGDDRAGELEYRSEEVSGQLVVVDHQHVDAA